MSATLRIPCDAKLCFFEIDYSHSSLIPWICMRDREQTRAKFDCGVFEKENEIHERDSYEITVINRDEIHSK